jgi:hypothetical protein
MSLDEVRSHNFVSKPSGGWMHSDEVLATKGVNFTVRVSVFYIIRWQSSEKMYPYFDDCSILTSSSIPIFSTSVA